MGTEPRIYTVHRATLDTSGRTFVLRQAVITQSGIFDDRDAGCIIGTIETVRAHIPKGCRRGPDFEEMPDLAEWWFT